MIILTAWDISMRPTILALILMMPLHLWANVSSPHGTIFFDADSNQTPEMVLNSTGLGVGTMTPAASLHVFGNAIISGNLSIGLSVLAANLGISGTFGQSSKTLSNNATLSDHSLYFIDTSAGNLILILPQASACSGRMITVKKITTSNNVVIIDHANSDIEGQGYVVLDNSSTAYPTVQFLSNGSAWYITDRSSGASTVAQAGFITTWQTDDQSGSGNTGITQIKLPLYNGGTYNFQVFWGDGSFDTVNAWNGAGNTHTYSVAGTYKVRIVGTCWGWRCINAFDRRKLYNIQQWGTDFRLVNAQNAFMDCTNLTITATDNLNLTGSSSFYQLFYGCKSLTTAPTMALWDTSNITNMGDIFRDCTNYNQSVNLWNTGKVTTLVNSFSKCTNFNQPLNSWNTANVTALDSILYECRTFNQDISSWNTGKVLTPTNAFYGCNVFNQPLNTWNTANVTTLSGILHGCTNFNQPLDTWNTGKVTTLVNAFNGCATFNQPLNTWNTANVNSLNTTFNSCSAFNQDISSWNTGNVTTLNNAFYGCNIFNQPLNSWNTANVTIMSGVLRNCIAFNQPLNSWNTGKVTTLYTSFYGCAAFNQPLNTWNTANVQNLSSTFDSCTIFNQDLSSWNVSAVTNFKSAFTKAYAFKQNLSSWTPISGTDFSQMFNLVDLNATGTTTNYDALLNAWGSLAGLPTGKSFSANWSKYSTAASGNRLILTTTKGWTITDGGPGP